MSNFTDIMLPGPRVQPDRQAEDVLQDIDEHGAGRGVVDREPDMSMGAPLRKKPCRRPTPRTRKLHPRVLPSAGKAFLDAAMKRRFCQGQLLM